ncbi:lactoylglutathione lyase [Sphingobacteriales bacterium UPWRP_1]|nr:lactoylglutathione lyase [Sphingobacteriales bacterium TSM_CSM]PSJ79121.1 lactoylglutathione lyase [Sphingobacteriales bacterium UPWRP_1]
MIAALQTILYVQNQEASRLFYSRLLRIEPTLHVPGMTEFTIAPNCKIGLMPNNSIAKILNGKTPHPQTGNGIPRCELYITVNNVWLEQENALTAGATLICPVKDYDWGDRACYFYDPDGHIIAFAEKIQE